MIISINQAQPGRILIMSGLFLFLFSSNFLDSQQLTRDELYSELRALQQNDKPLSIAMIKDNRLLIKPFVDGLIKESISAELKGNSTEAKRLQVMSANAANYFENTFGERSLSIAVNYLTIWSKDQMEIKLTADSLYTVGT